MKKCYKCKLVKPISEFYKNKNTKDGHEIRCKICCKKHNEEYYENNKIRLRQYAIEYRINNKNSVRQYHTLNRSKIKIQQFEYREKNKKKSNAKSKKWRESQRGRKWRNDYYRCMSKESPEKLKAYYAVRCAIKSGKFERESCSICETTERIHAHHDDYLRPLDVDWLCPGCHKLWHILLNEWRKQEGEKRNGII